MALKFTENQIKFVSGAIDTGSEKQWHELSQHYNILIILIK